MLFTKNLNGCFHIFTVPNTAHEVYCKFLLSVCLQINHMFHVSCSLLVRFFIKGCEYYLAIHSAVLTTNFLTRELLVSVVDFR